MIGTAEIVRNAFEAGVMIPAFNVPYLPMVEPVVRALVDTDSFGLVATARLEWYKFEAKGLKPVRDEFKKWEQPDYVRLHLDHVPVIDEDDVHVDFPPILQEAVDLGYGSIMVDGSRLDLDGNIAAAARATEIAHGAGVPCEAELGAVFGHEAGPPPPYEELFKSGRGFTDVDDAVRFVKESGCDWLSVAIGNIHGAVSTAMRDKAKVAARLNIDHLETLRTATEIPLVLHGGSGVQRDYVLEAMKHGIAKINIGTEIRQAYDKAFQQTRAVKDAQDAVYERTCYLLRDYFELAGKRAQVLGGG